MAFSNRIRLPFMLHKPQFLENAERYRKANGVTVTLSVVVRKVYEGLTDRLPEKLHERLKIALVHDSVQVEGDKYVGVVTQEGDYQIEWQDFLSHPLAQGKFKAEVTPFNATNSNCGTCEEMIQIVANDDNLGDINEGTQHIVDVLANDNICCNPVQVSIVTFNSDYLAGLLLLPDNTIDITLKNPAPSANGVSLVTYRAQCQNGQYDDANIIANVSGSLPSCLAPTGLIVDNVTATTASLDWNDVVGAAGYTWVLYKAPDFVTPVAGGSIAASPSEITIDPIEPSTNYRFGVRTECGGGNNSNYVYIDFTTDAADNVFCGRYRITSTTFAARPVTYVDCNGETRVFVLAAFANIEVCAMQLSPGVPVDIHGGILTIDYLGLC